MTAGTPTFEATDQYDLLALVSDEDRLVGRQSVDAFLAACEADAEAHGGIVSVNRVGRRLEEADIEHHRYSSFWSDFTGKGRPMRKATTDDIPDPWEIREGSKSENNGKPMRLRVWVGFLEQEADQ